MHGPFPIKAPRTVREAAALVGSGWEVDVIATRRHGERSRETINGVNVIRLPLVHKRGVGLAQFFWEYFAFASLATALTAWRQLRRRYRVVQVKGPPDFLIVAAAVPKALGAKVVLDVHDLSSDMFSMRFEGRQWARAAESALRLVERVACSFAHAVVTVHEPYRQELARRSVPARKVTVVMNSVDERLLPREPLDPTPAAFRIVYHGTVTPHYGVELMVDAFAHVREHVPDARLEIYGEGDQLPRVIARAAEIGVGDAVCSSDGYLPHEDVLAKVAGASVGVVPNLPVKLNRFALSTKLMEYVALRVPVVIADLPTLRAHFSEREACFFRAGDAAALAAALRSVAEDPDAAATRAEAARRRYDRDYRWPTSAERYIRVIGTLSGRPDSIATTSTEGT